MHLVRASPGARPPHVVRRAELWCTTDAGTVAPTPPRTSESRASPMRNTHPSIRAHKTASASTSKPTEAKRGRAIEIVGAAARWHRWVSWDRGLHQHKMQDDLWRTVGTRRRRGWSSLMAQPYAHAGYYHFHASALVAGARLHPSWLRHPAC